MVASLPKSLISVVLLFAACTGCALSRSKVGKADKGPPLALTQPAPAGSSIATGVVPIQAANAGTENVYPLQQVAAYAPANAAAETIVVTAPQPGFHDMSNNASMPSQLTQLQPVTLADRVNSEMMYGNYLIETGDSLDIKFRNTTELDEVVTVRPDGMISLPIVGDVQAAGLTPEGLRQSLMARYAGELKQPDIAVIVRSFSGNNVYIGGEVFSPGRIPLNGRVTTLNAIILAGGFKDTADQKRVIVRRADGSCCEHDLKSVLECKGGRDIPLQPYDVVYVPKSHIAKVNQFVDQYIEKVLPFSRSFGIFVSHNTGLTSAVGSP